MLRVMWKLGLCAVLPLAYFATMNLQLGSNRCCKHYGGCIGHPKCTLITYEVGGNAVQGWAKRDWQAELISTCIASVDPGTCQDGNPVVCATGVVYSSAAGCSAANPGAIVADIVYYKKGCKFSISLTFCDNVPPIDPPAVTEDYYIVTPR
jgi:hypothetical protein